MVKIVGIKERSGEYQGRQYRYYQLHCISSDDKAIGGVVTEVYKFKPAQLSAVCSLDNLNMLVGKEVKKISYDRYGNADDIQFN